MEYTPSLAGSTLRNSDELIRVLVEDPELSAWHDLHGALPPSGGFVVFERSGDLDQILADCQSIAPCVLLASYELVRSASRIDLRDRLIRAKGVSVLVRGAVSREAAELLLAEGIMGLIPDSVNGSLLRKAICSVARGEVWAGRLLVSRLLRKLQVRLTTQDLSDRELEILELITKGLSNREIAEKLFICRETVRWHIRSLYSKIGLKNRAAAVRYGKEILVAGLPPLTTCISHTSSDAQTGPPDDQIAAD